MGSKRGGIQVEGIRQLDLALKQLPDVVFDKAIKPATRQTAAHVRTVARKNARNDAHIGKTRTKLQIGKKKPSPMMRFVKGIKSGEIKFNKNKKTAEFAVGAVQGSEIASIIHLFELGVKGGYEIGGVFKRGIVAPVTRKPAKIHPGIPKGGFMEKTRNEVLPTIDTVFRLKLDKVIRRMQEKNNGR